ncbi:hypothetical protein ANO14919_038310 [Xylariales sp. No.14919]|nr:hypothetical protein ANO14919_038310 [Xylariales sp. No.14919]
MLPTTNNKEDKAGMLGKDKIDDKDFALSRVKRPPDTQ